MGTLGEKIRQLREDAALSQEELAEKLDVTRQTVSNWENDRATPDAHKIKHLCKIFGTSADELLGMPASQGKNLRPKRNYAAFVAAILLFLLAVACIPIACLGGGGEMTSTVIFQPAFLWGALAVVSAAAAAVSLIFFLKK